MCLGAQAIAVVFGAKLFNLNQVMHGKKSMIRLLDKNTRLCSIYEDRPKCCVDYKSDGERCKQIKQCIN